MYIRILRLWEVQKLFKKIKLLSKRLTEYIQWPQNVYGLLGRESDRTVLRAIERDGVTSERMWFARIMTRRTPQYNNLFWVLCIGYYCMFKQNQQGIK